MFIFQGNTLVGINGWDAFLWKVRKVIVKERGRKCERGWLDTLDTGVFAKRSVVEKMEADDLEFDYLKTVPAYLLESLHVAPVYLNL